MPTFFGRGELWLKICLPLPPSTRNDRCDASAYNIIHTSTTWWSMLIVYRDDQAYTHNNTSSSEHQRRVTGKNGGGDDTNCLMIDVPFSCSQKKDSVRVLKSIHNRIGDEYLETARFTTIKGGIKADRCSITHTFTHCNCGRCQLDFNWHQNTWWVATLHCNTRKLTKKKRATLK